MDLLHIVYVLTLKQLKNIQNVMLHTQLYVNNDCTMIIPMDKGSMFTYSRYLLTHQQQIHNAHHQNGVAEQAIQTISNMARAMLLHASMHWKQGIDSIMWPMAVHYATYASNILPRTFQYLRKQKCHVVLWGVQSFFLVGFVGKNNRYYKYEFPIFCLEQTIFLQVTYFLVFAFPDTN